MLNFEPKVFQIFEIQRGIYEWSYEFFLDRTHVAFRFYMNENRVPWRLCECCNIQRALEKSHSSWINCQNCQEEQNKIYSL